MIPYDIDPSLHDGHPQDSLDDGFSPPLHHQDAKPPHSAPHDPACESPLAGKSDF